MNDKNKLIYEISNDIRTVAEADNFCSEIDVILENFYKVKNKNLEEVLLTSTGTSTSTLIKKILSDNKISLADNASCEKILVQTRDEIKKMKIVKITLAIDPSSEIISHISEWINQNLEANTLLDIDKDEEILGGAVISINGRYKDFSLRKSLAEVFTKKKNELIGSISPK
ncbi:MAG: F0F1 ATP synthase subunit delta [Patescibacteria group bacterium]